MSSSLQTTTRHRVRVGNAVVAFEATGSGPPLVLIHGLSGSARWWDRNLHALAQHGRVYVIELLGFGESRGQRFALDAAAALLVQWMDRLAIERATLIGHSMGGAIAADIAADFPARLDRLVLVDAAVLPFGLHYLQYAPRLARELWQVPWGFLPVVLHDAWRAGPITMASAARQVMDIDLQPKLHQITAPTLLVWGERDVLVPPILGERAAQVIANSKLVTLPRAGHNAMWDQAEAFNQTVTQFLLDH